MSRVINVRQYCDFRFLLRTLLIATKLCIDKNTYVHKIKHKIKILRRKE